MGNLCSKLRYNTTPKATSVDHRDGANYLETFSQENLITETERDAIASKQTPGEAKQELFDLLMKKDDESSQRMVGILKKEGPPWLQSKKNKLTHTDSDPSKSNDDSDTDPSRVFAKANNPMEIAGAIRCVLGYLPLEDLRNCRLVNWEWCKTADPILWQRSIITVGYPHNRSCFSKSIENFRDVFKYSTGTIPFTGLRLRDFCSNYEPWPVELLEKILREWGKVGRELFIDHIHIRDVERSFNMSNILGFLNITKLKVKSYDTCRFSFALQKLSKIKHLWLKECDLYIEKGDTMSPISFELHQCRVFFTDDLASRDLNRFIDFKNTKELVIWVPDTGRGENRLEIELNGNAVLKRLVLHDMDVLNWSTSTWVVDKVKFSRVGFTGKSGLSVREFIVDQSLESLEYLPEMVETLTCNNSRFNTPAILPNLKHLNFTPRELETLSCFKNCPLLSSIIIEGNQEISVGCFPEVLKKLHIKGKITIVGDGVLRVGVLVVENYAASILRMLVNTVDAQRIVWTLNSQAKYGFDGQVFQFLESYRGEVAVGEFKWSCIEYFGSRFSEIVDSKDAYYLFEKGHNGRHIGKDQFNELMNSDEI